MKSSRWIVLAMAAATLGACSSGEEEGSAGEETAADESAIEGQALEPGLYESKVTVIEANMPDMPKMPAIPGMPDMPRDPVELMKRSMEKTRTYCLTPEEASAEALSRARKDAQEQIAENGDCKVERENNSATSIDMLVACDMPQGSATIAMTGGMVDGGTKMRVDFDGDMGGHKMSFVTEHVSRRIGDCTGDEG